MFCRQAEPVARDHLRRRNLSLFNPEVPEYLHQTRRHRTRGFGHILQCGPNSHPGRVRDAGICRSLRDELIEYNRQNSIPRSGFGERYVIRKTNDADLNPSVNVITPSAQCDLEI